MKKRFSRDRLKAASGLAETAAEEIPPAIEADNDLDDDDPETEAVGDLISVAVTPAEEGRRLDVILAARCPEFSRSQLAALAKAGRTLVDGRPAKPGQILTAGHTVTFPRPQAPPTDIQPDPGVILDVVYEDEHLLAVNKPWGLVVHPAPGLREPTLAGGLLARDARLSQVGEKFRPGLVHRLDRDTSGILITAKTEPALRALAAAFSARETRKSYLAFVWGRPARLAGLIDSPIGRHPTQRHKMAADHPRGRPSRTLYRVLRHFPRAGVSLVLLTLITGRTHQARVHLQSLGTPVLADPVYSRGPAELLKRWPHLAPHLQRQLLHARRLTLSHPVSGAPLTLRAPWPPDFTDLLKALLDLENRP